MAVQKAEIAADQPDMHPGQRVITNIVNVSRHDGKHGVISGVQVDTRVEAIPTGNRMRTVTVA